MRYFKKKLLYVNEFGFFFSSFHKSVEMSRTDRCLTYITFHIYCTSTDSKRFILHFKYYLCKKSKQLHHINLYDTYTLTTYLPIIRLTSACVIGFCCEADRSSFCCLEDFALSPSLLVDSELSSVVEVSLVLATSFVDACRCEMLH